MDIAMTASSKALGPGLGVLIQRLASAVGWPGIVGLIMMLLAAIAIGASWREHGTRQVDMHAMEGATQTPPGGQTAPSVVSVEQPLVEIPIETQSVTALLGVVERRAKARGLLWNKAEYTVLPPSETAARRLEIKASLKGNYVAIRTFVTDLPRSLPSTVIQAFDLSRPSAELDAVDARLTLTISLAADNAPLPASRP